MITAKRFVGFDVHRDTIAASVRDGSGSVRQRVLLETKAESVITFLRGLGPGTCLGFEEGTQAQWLCEITAPYVDRVIAADVRGRDRTKTTNDRIDADEISERLRTGQFRAVFRGTQRALRLKELVRNYNWLVEDTVRQMNRIKAAYRSRAIATNRTVYNPGSREQWLDRIDLPALRTRLEALYAVYDVTLEQRKQAKKAMIAEARVHPGWPRLRQIPFLGPVRVAQILGIAATPARFRGKKRFWAYLGLKVVTHDSAEHEPFNGRIRRRRRAPMTRGLNQNHNRTLKAVFIATAVIAAAQPGPFQNLYLNMVNGGMRPEMARLTLTRKIAAVALRLWKTGEPFDPDKLTEQS